jgi:hypothetical protein
MTSPAERARQTLSYRIVLASKIGLIGNKLAILPQFAYVYTFMPILFCCFIPIGVVLINVAYALNDLRASFGYFGGVHVIIMACVRIYSLCIFTRFKKTNNFIRFSETTRSIFRKSRIFLFQLTNQFQSVTIKSRM